MRNHLLETESRKSFYVLTVEKNGVKQYVKNAFGGIFTYTTRIKKARRLKTKEEALEFLALIRACMHDCEGKTVRNPEIKKVLRVLILTDDERGEHL